MEEVSAFHKAEGLGARHRVSTTGRVLLPLVARLLFRWFLELLFLSVRHVKGRVLVGLADGTLAIFHRGVGEASRVLFKNKSPHPDASGSITVCPPSARGRRPVGSDQLPPLGPGPAPPRRPLHDDSARQGVVRLPEQDPRGAAQSHEDRGLKHLPVILY